MRLSSCESAVHLRAAVSNRPTYLELRNVLKEKFKIFHSENEKLHFKLRKILKKYSVIKLYSMSIKD